jgi:type II secretory pathway component PulF
MPVFEYKATNPDGEPVSGTLISTDLVSAAAELGKRGFKVQHVGQAEVAGDPVPHDFQPSSSEATRENITDQRSAVMTQVVGPLVGRVSLSQLLFFFRQLATMLHAGVGIVQSLDTLAGQASDPRFRPVVKEISQHVREGRPISAGMQRYPEIFSPLMISIVRTGEEGGILDESLRQIAEHIQREIELRNLIRKATIYPKLVIGASIFIILVTNAIVGAVGGSSFITSPLTLGATWLILGPLIVLLFLFFRLGLAQPGVKYSYDQALLSIPVIGHTIQQFAMAKFGRSFAALYRAGVPVGKSVRLSADACGSEYIRSRVHPSAREIEEGASITESWARTGVFSPIVLDMAHTGETTGNLDDLLDHIAAFYEDDAAVRANQLAVALGVVCLIVVGVYVAYVVITFYTGYFSGIGGALEG